MKCEKCSSDTKIYESRYNPDLDIVRRRHCCLKCGHRFTTYEMRSDQMQKIMKSLFGKEIVMDIAKQIGKVSASIMYKKFNDIEKLSVVQSLRDDNKEEIKHG